MNIEEAWGGLWFRWLPQEPHPAWYCEQMSVSLRMNKPHPDAEDILERWAKRACRRRGKTLHAFGGGTFGDMAFFKGDLSPLGPVIEAMMRAMS